MMGLGYIGLPTAALIASKGVQVHGVDISPKVIDTINKGQIHIVEPDLDGLVKSAVERGKLKASDQPIEADVFLIAVPTPFKGDHQPDISYVEAATRMLIPFLKAGNLVILESTSPVGTTEKVAELIYANRPGLKGRMHIAYCPERVLPGKVIFELEQNDRVIGGLDQGATDAACKFYSSFVRGELHQTKARTAEMCKLVENASRDVNIAFANELSLICDEADINVWELINLANKHPRVNILQPGTGVGGHCIAVDPWFIVSDFPSQAKIIRQAREINNYKSEWVVEKIMQRTKELHDKLGREPKVACMGLAFKPDIDDLRESPALEVVHELIQKGVHVLPVEPNLEDHATLNLYYTDKAIEQADLICFLVKHAAFKHIDTGETDILDFCGLTFHSK